MSSYVRKESLISSSRLESSVHHQVPISEITWFSDDTAFFYLEIVVEHGDERLPLARASASLNTAVPAGAFATRVGNKLIVVGGSGDDEIRIEQHDNRVHVYDHARLIDEFLSRNIKEIIVQGSEGDDAIVHDTKKRFTALGGAGDDVLVGSDRARDVLFGQLGNDLMSGLGANDKLVDELGSIMIGGQGRDSLFSNRANTTSNYGSLLVTGRTSFESDIARLRGLRDAWSASTESREAVVETLVADLLGDKANRDRVRGSIGVIDYVFLESNLEQKLSALEAIDEIVQVLVAPSNR